MPKFRDRECVSCGSILRATASRSETCKECAKQAKKEKDSLEEKLLMQSWGYEYIGSLGENRFGKRKYSLRTPCCGNVYDVVFQNLRKQINNSKAKNLPIPCGVCGPQHRMKVALEGFMDKYAIDYDLDKANDYRRKVRGLTELVYKKNKHVINPNNLPRGHHDYHVDHIIPIIECFKRGWSVEQAADVSNLQMLKSEENLSKGKALQD